MTGKEIADIFRKYNSCKNCELVNFSGCYRMICALEDAAPGDIYDILEKDYGGDKE